MTDMNKKLNNRHAPAAVALLLSLTVAACSHDKPLEISSCVRYSQLDDEGLVAEKGCIEYDSIVFSDNSYAVMELRNAPQNMLTRYVDSGGRLMATVSAPSETYAQRLVTDTTTKAGCAICCVSTSWASRSFGKRTQTVHTWASGWP
jgi:hypothetical protein